jgi:hypothetical protein
MSGPVVATIMHELPSDPVAWLDKYSAEQRCNVEVVERVSDFSFAEVAALCEWPEESQAQAHAVMAHQRST